MFSFSPTQMYLQIKLSCFFLATRFVKCEKCNHFFVVIPENDKQKGSLKENLKDNNAKNAHKRKPPPPPKKVGNKLVFFF